MPYDRNAAKKIEALSSENKYVTNLFYLMKELHISYTELCEMPVPAIMILIEELAEHQKKERAASKKKR